MNETDSKQIWTRKKKIMPGETTKDEVSSSPSDIFRRDVYYKVLDAIITSIEVRFNDSRDILKDLSLLSPERLMSTDDNYILTNNPFNNLKQLIVNIDEAALRTKYLTFKNSLNELLSGHELQLNYFNNNKSNSDSERSTEDSPDEVDQKKKKLSCLQILELLSSYALVGAFPNLYVAYKSLCTMPISSASAERSFSKVIIVFIYLR